MLAGKRLLVVDDNMVNRRVASSMLKRYGAEVENVNGGNQAINAVKKRDDDTQFDMILMDIQMPEVLINTHIQLCSVVSGFSLIFSQRILSTTLDCTSRSNKLKT